MRVMFTGGGTGGHILPNIAVIEALRKIANKSRLEIFYIGEKHSLEERLMQEKGISFYPIMSGKMRRYFDIKNIIDAAKVPVGVIQAYWALRAVKPHLVFAKGGYVSVPVCIAAFLLRIPLWIHESDATPGLATKISAKFAKKIFLSFEETRGFFSCSRAQIHVVGNPVRPSVIKGNREIGLKLAGLSHDTPVLLVTGGSTGAHFLNDFVKLNLKELLKFTQVIHITGRNKSESTKQKLSWGYARFEYLNEDMAHVYAASDVVLSRAGSGSIFENLALHKPMVLVPLPKFASRGDQIINAEIFAKHGLALKVDQENILSKDLVSLLKKLITDDQERREMIKNQKKFHIENAADRIASFILKV